MQRGFSFLLFYVTLCIAAFFTGVSVSNALLNGVVNAMHPFMEPEDDVMKELKLTYAAAEKLLPYVGHVGYLYQKNDLTKRQYYNSYAVFPGVGPKRQHGILGVYPNNTPVFIPSPRPPPVNMSDPYPYLADGGFYLNLSDALPLDREAHDCLSKSCKDVHYDLKTLEDVSVIITFYNEPYSILLRTLHSLLNITPPPLLREIILVDDHSDRPGVRPGEFLYDSIKLLPKVKLMRLPERRGLVIARLAGVRASSAPIIVVLDSHLEFTPRWLEPQLQRIKESPRSLVFPQIPSLNAYDFSYNYRDGIGCSMGFTWIMQEESFYVKHPASPEITESLSMAGGLFAVRADVFWELGGYDEEFSMWGAENVEMGFRYWLCGYRIECAPCSYVYHIYRTKGVGYKTNVKAIIKNRLRTARLWTDKYYPIVKRFVKGEGVDLGSFDQMLELKKRLKCKNFDWIFHFRNAGYLPSMNNEPRVITAIKNVHNPTYCVDALAVTRDSKYGLYPCYNVSTMQTFIYQKGLLYLGSSLKQCLSSTLKIKDCITQWADEKRWMLDNGTIRWSGSPDLCLTFNSSTVHNEMVMFDRCNQTGTRHLWNITYMELPYVPPLEFSEEYKKDHSLIPPS